MSAQKKAIEELKAKRDVAIAAQDEKWQREIDLLEARVTSNFKDIQIGMNNETIAIRASLSDADTNKIAKLNTERAKLNPEKDEAKINAFTYEILERITANPIMTADWFAMNRERYSTEDLLAVTLGYYGHMAERVKRVSSIKSFRKK